MSLFLPEVCLGWGWGPSPRTHRTAAWWCSTKDSCLHAPYSCTHRPPHPRPRTNTPCQSGMKGLGKKLALILQETWPQLFSASARWSKATSILQKSWSFESFRSRSKCSPCRASGRQRTPPLGLQSCCRSPGRCRWAQSCRRSSSRIRPQPSCSCGTVWVTGMGSGVQFSSSARFLTVFFVPISARKKPKTKSPEI